MHLPIQKRIPSTYIAMTMSDKLTCIFETCTHQQRPDNDNWNRNLQVLIDPAFDGVTSVASLTGLVITMAPITARRTIDKGRL